MGLTSPALLFDVCKLATCGDLTIASYDASTPQRGEPQKHYETAHSNLRRRDDVQVLYLRFVVSGQIASINSPGGDVPFF
jgi:hypothetical protein